MSKVICFTNPPYLAKKIEEKVKEIIEELGEYKKVIEDWTFVINYDTTKERVEEKISWDYHKKILYIYYGIPENPIRDENLAIYRIVHILFHEIGHLILESLIGEIHEIFAECFSYRMLEKYFPREVELWLRKDKANEEAHLIARRIYKEIRDEKIEKMLCNILLKLSSNKP